MRGTNSVVKTAVSTLGTPGWGLADAIRMASAFGLDGLELRLHPDTGVHAGLSVEERQAARAAVENAGLEIPVLAGYAKIAAEGPDAPVVEALRADLLLAADLGAQAVRVFPGGRDLDAAARRLSAVAEAARRLSAVADTSVRVLIETHDALPTGNAVATLLDRVRTFSTTERLTSLSRQSVGHAGDAVGAGASPPVPPEDIGREHSTAGFIDQTNTDVGADERSDVTSAASSGAAGKLPRVGAIWDVLHPWRSGESPADTVAALGPWLDYVQIKDAAADLTPVPLGQGRVPLDEVRAALAAAGYSGWISLEWERTWYPHALPVEEVLPGALAWIDAYGKA